MTMFPFLKLTNLLSWVGKTVFKYDSTHALDEVDESGYSSCSSSKPIKSNSDGNTKIELSSAGKRYFLCPTSGHCAGGMKLAVNVVGASGTPPTTPSGSPPKTPSTSPPPPSESGSPATNTSSSPSPKPSGAVSVSSSVALLVGSFFALAIMF